MRALSPKLRLLATAIAFIWVAGLAYAQLVKLGAPASPAPAPAPADTLRRTAPQEAMYAFLETCHEGNFTRAAQYLDLHRLSLGDRRTEGPKLAQWLQEIVDYNPQFHIGQLSRDLAGDQNDGLPPDTDRFLTAELAGQAVDLTLQRNPTSHLWLVSVDTVNLIGPLHDQLTESWFETHLPAPLVKIRFFGTSLWRWIALALICVVLSAISSPLSRALFAVSRPLTRRIAKNEDLHQRFGVLFGPVRLLIAAMIFGICVQVVGFSALTRLWIARGLALVFFLAIGWLIGRVMDLVAYRIQQRLETNQRDISKSVLPLGVRVVKVTVFCLALLATLANWGYNTNAILAGLGLGGVAIALAAQKTLENFFGSISLISDRPVLVGDFCRYGDQVGTVEDIGLRSTRIRSLDRTLVTIPNGTFSAMTLENFSKREKIWFNPKFGLRLDASTQQIRRMMDGVIRLLREHPRVETFLTPVRFTGITDTAFRFEVFAYILTADVDTFLAIQSDLLLQILNAIEEAGAQISIPITQTYTLTSDQAPAASRIGAATVNAPRAHRE